jgi:hypothetical protein
MTRHVALKVVESDALRFDADVLALKHAQSLFGVDRAAYERLGDVELPREGEFALVSSEGGLSAKSVLFLGVETLGRFGYPEIRDFGRRVLSTIATKLPEARHIALTIHGPGYGLDEIEAFESELAGVVEAISSGDFPPGLEVVSFVERNPRRATRLSASLMSLVPNGRLLVDHGSSINTLEGSAQNTLRSAGYASAGKPHLFVAMPFAPEMDDVFHFGIQGASNAAGLLCERADLSTFAGDVMDWVKNRISTAKLVVADLSSSNPNVYLEVGYAWGRGVPTVLVARDSNDLKFDVRGQRCIIYKSIRQLEELLSRELKGLIGKS